MAYQPTANDVLLAPGQAATILGVDRRTVTYWANMGLLHPDRSEGGHRRYWQSEVRALIRSRL